jgi:hypothetical protein
MTADQIWQTLVTVGSVGVLVFTSAWGLARALDTVRASVRELKAEVQSDVSAVRSDVALLRASIDGRLALVEAQTKAEIAALKATADRHDEEIAALRAGGAPVARPKRRGAA